MCTASLNAGAISSTFCLKHGFSIAEAKEIVQLPEGCVSLSIVDPDGDNVAER